MKVIAAFFAATTLVLMIACSGDGGNSLIPRSNGADTAGETRNLGDGVTIDSGGAYHLAIDTDFAADEGIRKSAYLLVAEALTKDQIPTPHEELIYTVGWEEPVDGNAALTVTGMFREGVEWVEKFVDFQMKRKPNGQWYVVTPFTSEDFVWTAEEADKQAQKQKEIEDEIQRQDDLLKLNRIQEAFDSITVEFINTEYVPDENGDPGVEGFIFHLGLSNPNQYPHSVTYNIEWRETMFTAVGDRCWRDYEYSSEFDQSSSEEISPQSEIQIEEQPYTSTAYTKRFCDDLRVDILDLSIIKIDGYTREKLSTELANNQTSP